MHPLKYFVILLLACCVSSYSADRQSPIGPEACKKDCKVTDLWELCCPSVHPCCCCSAVCTKKGCMQYLGEPHEPPETAFFKFTGLGPCAPCCGPECSMNQCLELIKLQLLAIQDPLRAQRDSLEKSADEVDCCGEGCSNRGCFSDILTNLIQLQSPIQNTQNATEYAIAKEEA
jgi:hypothetical protein